MCARVARRFPTAQWLRWTSPDAARHFPVLAVRRDALWRRVGDLAAFVGVDVHRAAAALPLQREPTRARGAGALGALGACRAHAMYDSLRARVRAAPEIMVTWGDVTYAEVRDLPFLDTPSEGRNRSATLR